MSLSFLPDRIRDSLSHLNYNKLTEIRLRKGQPVLVGYGGEYRYLGVNGVCSGANSAIIADEVEAVINAATGGCIYNYTEQMKGGFITVGHGIRIGIAGEYVTQGGVVTAVKNITSLNLRIPHDIIGCSQKICESLFLGGREASELPSTLIFAKPGLGKTTMLRDVARFMSANLSKNVLIFDERGEIAAIDGFGNGFDLGAHVDVVRSSNKLDAVASAIRAMKPDVVVTDELYGERDKIAVEYVSDCGICVVASSHTVDRRKLKEMPFEFYVELKKLGGAPEIYDKNFNSYSPRGPDDFDRHIPVGKQEEKDVSL